MTETLKGRAENAEEKRAASSRSIRPELRREASSAAWGSRLLNRHR